MNTLDSILDSLRSRNIDDELIAKTLEKIFSPNSDCLDYDREDRCGFPEVIYAEFKSAQETLTICQKLAIKSDKVLITRLNKEKYLELSEFYPNAFYDEASQIFFLGDFTQRSQSKLLIISAGTSDSQVSQETYYCAKAFGLNPELIQDIGVASLQRLTHRQEQIKNADCLIVVAGMEGALPSVIGGLTTTPIIALPTSVGYGANLQGITTLMAMMTSCASGISVVNIDNGFGAAYAALRMIKTLGDYE